MNSVYIHLITNHIPFFGIIFGLISLTISILKNSNDLKKLGLITIIISSVMILPVYFSGDKAEKIVEDLPGVSEQLIEEHEDMAKVSVASSLILGFLAFIAVFLKDKKQKNVLFLILLVGLISEIAIIRTASLGGQIRHTEINSNQTIINNNSDDD